MAGLDDDGPIAELAADAAAERLTSRGGDLPGMGNEGDDARRWAVHRARTVGSASPVATLRRRRPVARLWPVIVATSRRSIARSAVSRRSVVSAPSKPRRRAATASSWWNGARNRRKPSIVWLNESPIPAAIRP